MIVPRSSLRWSQKPIAFSCGGGDAAPSEKGSLVSLTGAKLDGHEAETEAFCPRRRYSAEVID